MIGFKIKIKDQEFSIGIENGVATVIFTRVLGENRNETNLDIAGVTTLHNERKHLKWADIPLKLGDEIHISVTEIDAVSPPETI